MRQLEEFFFHFRMTETTCRQVFVICGLGGTGKTRLAAEFSRKNHTRFSAVFWINGSSKQTVMQSFARIARQISSAELADCSQSLPVSQTATDASIDIVFRWLSLPSNRRWLLVFDNVDHDRSDLTGDPGSYNLTEYFPPSDQGSILVTSRLKSFLQYGTGLELKTVTHYQAIRILEGSSNVQIEGGFSPTSITGSNIILTTRKMLT